MGCFTLCEAASLKVVFFHTPRRDSKDHVQQDDQLTDFTIEMDVIHCAVLSPFNGSWNYALASVSSYKQVIISPL